MLRRAPVGKDGVARVGTRYIYILPTSTGLFFALTVAAMVLGSLNFQNNLGLAFGFFMAAIGLVAMHRCWYNLLGLAAEVRSGPSVFAGATAQFEVILRNERRAPRYDIRVVGGIDIVRPVTLEALDQCSVTVSVTSARRGYLRIPEVRLETRHPMHLFSAWCYAANHAQCLIYPRPSANAPAPILHAGDTRRAARGSAQGIDDYLGPRVYRRGDSPRRLDWKALARERGLVVKEFGGDQGVEVWVDWSALQQSDIEQRLSILARQVLDAAQANVRFGLRLPGVEIGLGRGQGQAERCLTKLAGYGYATVASAGDRRSS